MMIYLLEDDENIRNFVLYALRNSGFSAEGFELPSEFWNRLNTQLPSLLLLDVMLPEEDGLEILKKLKSRENTKNIPVIMLTAKTTEYDKVIGLDGGADDYISKPFGTMELISRIKAVLRRSNPQEVDNKTEFRAGNLYVSTSEHIVTVSGEKISLTFKEFELLCLFLRNRGKVFSRDNILQEIWGYEFDGESRTVDVHIRTLRSKLKECGNLIETVRGIGYKIGGAYDEKNI